MQSVYTEFGKGIKYAHQISIMRSKIYAIMCVRAEFCQSHWSCNILIKLSEVT